MTMREQKRESFRNGMGVYTCSECGRETRGSKDSFSVEMCRWCYEEAGYDNALSDGAITKEEYDDYIREIEEDRSHNQKGGRFLKLE